MATSIDDNAADGIIGKYKVGVFKNDYTRRYMLIFQPIQIFNSKIIPTIPHKRIVGIDFILIWYLY